MLTAKQAELLAFIDRRIRASGGIAPSFEEMKQAVGVNSKSDIRRRLIGLEERGFIRRLPARARAIEILRPPPSTGGEISLDLVVDLVDRELGIAADPAAKAALERLRIQLIPQSPMTEPTR